MNRFKITRKSFDDTKQFLAGKLNLSKAPKYAQKFKNDLVVKGNTILYKGKRLLAQEDRDTYMRKLIYDRGSIIPMNRDQGYAAIQKEVWGIPLRIWYA